MASPQEEQLLRAKISRMRSRFTLSESENWIEPAMRAVHVKEKNCDRNSWSGTLAFPDVSQEAAFLMYFYQLKKYSTRIGLLVLSFLYMIMVISTWHFETVSSRPVLSGPLVLRLCYVSVLFIGFGLSFTPIYHLHFHVLSSGMSLLTGIDIVLEGALFSVIYSPYIVLVLICFLVGWNAFLRLR